MAVSGTPILVPGTSIPPSFPLARYRFPELEGVVRAFIRSTTRSGDLILAIGAVSGRAVAEVVAEERRIVALGRNPLDLLCASLSLGAAPGAQVQAALTQLGDQPKAGRPLILHTKSQYESQCPHCHQPGTAEWFAWDRERGRPFAKRVACPHCEQAHEGPVDADDLHRAGTYPVTSGMAYHLALSRAAGQDPSDVSRVAQLVQLYTPRNLTSLMDLIQRVPQTHVDHNVRRALEALLLEALDAGSALVPYDDPGARPRSLRVPQRFLERNVWMALENAAAAYRDHYGSSKPPTPTAPPTEGLATFLTHPKPGYILLNRSIQSLSDHNLEGAFGGLIVHLAPPDATSWALGVLWSLWLWGDDVPSDLGGFLQRRRLDWEWYQRSLAAALNYARPYLAPDAPVLLLATTAALGAARAVTHAANRSGLASDRWLVCPPNGCRVLMHFQNDTKAQAIAAESTPAQNADEVASRILQERGEPTDRKTLEAALVLQSRRDHVLEQEPGPGSPLTTLGDKSLWLRKPARAETPLADRVEATAFRLLASEEHWELDELLERLYGEFHGPLSPERELVQAIIEAYSQAGPVGTLSIRPEDDPQRRQRELQQLRKDLLTLAERLGYSPARRLNGDIVWREDGSQPYLFRTTTSALLSPHLLKTPPRCDGRRCLVLPGGRAALIALKLRRDLRMAQLAVDQNWTFIKFRHLRRMIQEITEPAEIEVFLGLDPLVEKQSAQIPLPLHMKARP